MNFDRLRETKGVIKAHKKAPVSGLFYVYLVFGAEGGNKPHRKPYNYQSVTCQFLVKVYQKYTEASSETCEKIIPPGRDNCCHCRSSSTPDTSEADLKNKVFRDRAVIACVELLLCLGR